MKTITKNEAYIYVTQCHLGMLMGDESYEDNASLSEALMRIENLDDNIIVKEDIEGWRNPYLDMLAEEME